MDISSLEEWQFGRNKQECDELFGLVLNGQKRATSFLFCEPVDNVVYSVVANWDRSEKILLKSTKFEIKRFCDVTKEHAKLEGEGDKTLEYWRCVHKKFFEEEAKLQGLSFDENTLIVCEEFDVVGRI